jgi:hypothetical protein
MRDDEVQAHFDLLALRVQKYKCFASTKAQTLTRDDEVLAPLDLLALPVQTYKY